MRYGYCLGIRLDDDYNERTCRYRDDCPYYGKVRLSVLLSSPDIYEELDTYNNRECVYRQAR